MSAVTSVVGIINPFPGLRPFREDEQKLFFGREAQVDRIVDKLAVSHFLAVVGSSGSGKSSLVNCGLKPALRRGLLTSAGSSWRMIQFRPGANPTYALACALVEDGSIIHSFGSSCTGPDLIEATLGLSGFGLVDIHKHSKLDPDTNLLIVVDQFEELFRYRSLSAGGGYGQGPQPQAIRFVRLLLDSACQRDVPIYVVLTMRSDFLGDCAQFDGLPEAICEGQYLVPRMTREERRAAIEGPIRVVDCNIGVALLTRLVNDVGDNPDQLSILQHAMNRTWAHWRHDGGAQRPIDVNDYETVGTMKMALDRHAEKAYGELPPGRQRVICERVFKTLTDRGTDPRGMRRPTKLACLREIAGATDDELMKVLRPFRKASRSFLVPTESDKIDDSSVIDISHESLMRIWMRLNLWANEEAEAARNYRLLLDRAEDHSLKKGGLMRDPDLQTALDFRAHQQPTPAWANMYGGKFQQAMEYLRSSEEQRLFDRADRELERRWRLRWQSIIFGVAALAFLFVLFKYQRLLMPIQQLSGQDLRDRLYDTFKYGFRVSLVLLGIGLGCLGTLRLGRSLHRKYALPAILNALRNPLPVVQFVELPAQDPVKTSGTIYASGWRRAGAFLIDSVIAFVLAVLAVMISAGLATSLRSMTSDTAYVAVAAVYGGGFLLVCVYHVLTDGSRMQASLGMRVVRIYVADLNGRRLSRFKVLKRQVLKVLWFAIVLFLGTLPLLVFLAAYLIVKRNNPDSPAVRLRQWPHDIASKSVVLVGRPPDTSSATSVSADSERVADRPLDCSPSL